MSRPSRAFRLLLSYLRVPFFDYCFQVVLIHLLVVAICYAHYRRVYWMFQSPDLANYPLCRRFAALKRRRHDA